MLTADAYETLEADKRMIKISSAFASYEVRERNEDKASRKGLWSCICCGKGTTSANRKWVLNVNGSHEHVANPDEDAFWEANDGGYMGFSPVGPSCAKKLRKLGVPAEWFTVITD